MHSYNLLSNTPLYKSFDNVNLSSEPLWSHMTCQPADYSSDHLALTSTVVLSRLEDAFENLIGRSCLYLIIFCAAPFTM